MIDLIHMCENLGRAIFGKAKPSNMLLEIFEGEAQQMNLFGARLSISLRLRDG